MSAVSAFDRPSGVHVVNPTSSMSNNHDRDAPNSAAVASAANGQDVTSTSPSASSGSNVLSVRPLPSPSLFPPSVVSPTAPGQDRHLPTSTATTTTTSAGNHHQYQVSSLSTANEHSPSPSPSPSSGSGSGTTGEKMKENTGRWSTEEHQVFLKGLNEHGKQWKKIAVMIKTRSVVQVRTHAQKYFQKLLKAEKKGGDANKISTSTATSTATGGAVKRKSSTSTSSVSSSSKGNQNKGKMTSAASITNPAMPPVGNTSKRRKVSLEPKKQSLLAATAMQARRMPPAPFNPHHQPNNSEHAIDPSFMSTLHMADGELDDSLLDLLDDSSVDAVEHVIGTDDDDDLEPNPVDMSPNPVSPSTSAVSLADSSSAASISNNSRRRQGTVDHQNYNHEISESMMVPTNRNDLVTSPNPTSTSEDFSIHNKIGTSGGELSPTSVACMMDIKDFEQKTSNYVDPLDWLMDVGVYQLPASAGEGDEDFYNDHNRHQQHHHQSISANKLAQVNSSALSVLDDVF